MSAKVQLSPVLTDIVVATEKRVRQLEVTPVAAPPIQRTPLDFVAALMNQPIAVIAEVKAASPSQGLIRAGMDAVQIAATYARAGAAAISVLTEPNYFHGSLDNLVRIRQAFPHVPLLQKDFIIAECQIDQALACGADAILLILAVLGEARAAQLQTYAQALGLSVLVEVHDAEEMLSALRIKARLIGVNNRNLRTMEVSLLPSRALVGLIPQGTVVISESGLETREQVKELQHLGYQGFLIGTSLMKNADPGQALRVLLGAEERAT
jgi:indole-3-glycerol phosphate synthase